VHGDIKPANIMVVNESDGTDIVKLLDFGIARCMQAHGRTEAAIGNGTGTPANESGTVSKYGLDCRSDIYSLGCVMYQVLTKSTPFVGNSAIETLSSIVR